MTELSATAFMPRHYDLDRDPACMQAGRGGLSVLFEVGKTEFLRLVAVTYSFVEAICAAAEGREKTVPCGYASP
jgi:hypothetical protein